MNPLFEQLERRACRSPDAVVLETDDCRLNISELLAQVQETRFSLKAGGYQTVALYADNSPEWVVVDLACQGEDICLVPLPTFFSAQQLSHVIKSAGVELLLYQRGLADNLPGELRVGGPEFPLLPSLTGLPLSPAGRARVPHGTAKITFTSGSTGEPRGVCLSSTHCLNVAGSLAQATGLQGPRHLCVLPLPVLLENVAGVYAPLLVGGCVLTPPLQTLGFEGSAGVDPRRFLAALHHYRPETLILVPQLLALLDRALDLGWEAPGSLRFIAVGGARVAPSLVERVRARGLPVYEGYGLSECASVVSLNCPGRDRPGSSGQVLGHVRVSDHAGQLRVTGNAFLGYLNQPDSWYPDHIDTGDIGSVDGDGFVRIEGRAKNLIINSYGRNISPEWIESELAAAGTFRQSVVFGDGQAYCTALLYPLDEHCSDTAIQSAVDQVNRRLPDYARVREWARLPRPLAAADGLLTDNGRPRRNLIELAYGHLIDTLYPDTKELKAL